MSVTVDTLLIDIQGKATGASSSIDKTSRSLNKLKGATSRATGGLNRTKQAFAKFAIKAAVVVIAIRKISQAVGEWIKESNAYVENLNLFTASLGEYADEAKRYAEEVAEIMGIDPSEWIRNQGIFNTLIEGFGLSADKAAEMSKNLTQLGYDLSSFYNLEFADSMTKLQSGMSGELEPLRRLGYDLSQAKLQAIALSLGIDKAFSKMTQGEKVMLRYYAIMNQVTVAQGDMARTLAAPANQLRILAAQATQAKRALGNIFIPALNAILPYAIAFLKVIRWVAQSIADLFGFTMPVIDYSGLEDVAAQADTAGTALGGAAGAAKELKNATLGFDELNIIDPTISGGGSGIGGIGGIGFDVPTPGYDFIEGATQNNANQIFETMKENLLVVKETLSEIWENIKATGVVDAFTTAWTELKNAWAGFKETGFLKWLSELSLSVIIQEFANLFNITKDVIDIIGSLFSGDGEGFLNGLKDGLIDLTALGFDPLFLAIDKIFGTDTTGWFTTLKKNIKEFNAMEIGSGIFKAEMKLGETFNNIGAGIVEKLIKPFRKETWEELGTNLETGLSGLPGKLGYIMGDISREFSDWKANTMTWIRTEVPKIKNSIVSYFKNLPGNIGIAMKNIQSTISLWAIQARGWISQKLPEVINSITGWFAKIPGALANVGKDMVRGIWNGILKMGDWLRKKVSGFFGNVGSSVLDSLGSFGKGYQAGYYGVPEFATGGFPEDGLFFANSNELVGTFANGQTAVANNSQIIDGVSQGVARAVAAVLGGQGKEDRPLEVKVYIDGKQVTESVEKYQAGRGVQILGGVY